MSEIIQFFDELGDYRKGETVTVTSLRLRNGTTPTHTGVITQISITNAGAFLVLDRKHIVKIVEGK